MSVTYSASGPGATSLRKPSRKAENLNEVALPELERLAKEDAPFFLFLLMRQRA